MEEAGEAAEAGEEGGEELRAVVLVLASTEMTPLLRIRSALLRQPAQARTVAATATAPLFLLLRWVMTRGVMARLLPTPPPLAHHPHRLLLLSRVGRRGCEVAITATWALVRRTPSRRLRWTEGAPAATAATPQRRHRYSAPLPATTAPQPEPLGARSE